MATWARSLMLLRQGLFIPKYVGATSLKLSQGPSVVQAMCGCLNTTQVRLATSSAKLQASKQDNGSRGNNNNNGVDKLIEKNVEQIRKGDFSSITSPADLKHFRYEALKRKSQEDAAKAGEEIDVNNPTWTLPHPIWEDQELLSVQVTHKPPKGIIDRLAFNAVKLLRGGFDVLSGFNREERTEKIWVNRICFLETVAGVPGMVAAMVRHLHSLRRMRRDHGWIHTLLEEAENERMHLMTALQLKHPTFLFRWGVVITQGVFVTAFSLAYLLSPKFCHRFVGYLEEEAVVTYSKLLKDMDGGPMKHWNTQPAPELAINYWHLKPEATMYDVILAIRADEAHHRVVNHTLASLKKGDYNPYKPGE